MLSGGGSKAINLISLSTLGSLLCLRLAIWSSAGKKALSSSEMGVALLKHWYRVKDNLEVSSSVALALCSLPVLKCHWGVSGSHGSCYLLLQKCITSLLPPQMHFWLTCFLGLSLVESH